MQIRETDGWTEGEAVRQEWSERVMEMEGGRAIRGGEKEEDEERFSRWRGKTWKSSRIRSNEHVARAEEKSFPLT